MNTHVAYCSEIDISAYTEAHVFLPFEVGVVGRRVLVQIGQIISKLFGSFEVEGVDKARFGYLNNQTFCQRVN